VKVGRLYSALHSKEFYFIEGISDPPPDYSVVWHTVSVSKAEVRACIGNEVRFEQLKKKLYLRKKDKDTPVLQLLDRFEE